MTQPQGNPSKQMQAFSSLWIKAQPALSGFIVAALPDFHQAEDVLQNVGAVAAEKFASYDPKRPFLPWVIGIAHNEILKSRRNVARDQHQFSPDLLGGLGQYFSDTETHLDRYRQALNTCLKRLPTRNRSVMNQRYRENLPPRHIAQQQGVSSNAISILLHRSRQMVRECIERHIAEEEPDR